MSNKPGGLLRSGRRQSTPTSPTSPTFLRRLNRPQDVFPLDATPTESPTIDLTVPSPTFDLASISPSLAPENRFVQRPQSYNRSSDDFGKSRPRFLAETTRPATSNAEGSGWSTAQPRYTHSPEQPSSRDSPSFSGPRISSEGSGRSSSRENQDRASGTPFRSNAFLSQHDRSTGDDNSALKGVTSAKKSRFNLKSPRNLFARRRSSQITNKLDDGNVPLGKMHVPAMPDNIETSIRGSIVHDFSKPRTRRSNNDSSPVPAPLSSPSYPRRPSEFGLLSTPPSAATPTSLHFREHFQEEKGPVQPTNTAYLHSQNLQVPPSGALPDFAKRLPLSLPTENEIPAYQPVNPHVDGVKSEGKSTSMLTQKPDTSPPLPPAPLSPPPPPPPVLPDEPHSPELDLPPMDTLPKHMLSTSSRFSFQIGQQAQEKILEEKHKEHAQKQPAAARLSVVSVPDADDYDYENEMYDDDGFDNDDIVVRNIDMPSSQDPQIFSTAIEEDYGDEDDDQFETEEIMIRNIDIPTSQRGDREEGSYHNIKRQSLQAFHFTPQSLSFSPSTAQYTSMSTPRDVEGFPIGMAESKEGVMYDIQPQIRDSLDQPSDEMFLEGLGISTLTTQLPGLEHKSTQEQPFDDLYFDDGEFDDNVVEFDTEFDENLLDDAEHIRDIPAENSRKYDEALQQSMSGDRVKVVSHEDQTERVPQTPERGSLRIFPSQSDHQNILANTSDGLTEGNLAAYHDALAQAATQAAADGKFDRAVSFSRVSDDETDSPLQASIPALSSRGSKYSNNMVEPGISDEDGFGYEDDLYEDEMVAAANAEALENDDDGFYGQEFGFYARAHGKDSAEFSSGGYFTSRGSNGVKRSHSGKNNFQEPSLTPITERSEWSARNSVANLHQLPGAIQGLPSPGIAELIGWDSPLMEDEMSLAALSKIRSRTFGGSSTSINSLDRHHVHSSPLAHLSTHSKNLADAFGGKLSPPMIGINGMSIAESEDEDEDWGKPTLTQNTPHKKHADTVVHSLHEQISGSPLGRKGNHSRNSSGSESVSYAQDTDGGWVQERRRTGDNGEIELVQRKYLAGARI